MENGFDSLLAGEGPVAATRRSHRHCMRGWAVGRESPSLPGLFRRCCFLKMPNDAQRIMPFRRRDEAALWQRPYRIRVADRDRVNFAVFESALQHVAAQQFG